MTQTQTQTQIPEQTDGPERALPRTPPPTEADIKWAQKHGWKWDGKGFMPEPVIGVIVNPVESVQPGWTPWHVSIGALQMDAPFHSVRAALRAAQSIRLGRRLGEDEMDCSQEAE